MKRKYKLWAAALAAGLGTLHSARGFGQLAAFPGAEGFGAGATGGRTGHIVVVSNLNSSGAGSFAQAVETSNSIVVFNVSGYVNLGGEISVASNVTILGQTAPGGGIGLMDGELSFSSSSNDIVSYIRLRQGNGSSVDTNKSAIEMDNASNIVLDHDSIQFGEFDSADINSCNNVSLQSCIISDAIGQQFGIHAQGTTNFTIANSVFANDHNRNPFIENTGSVQLVNNVIYNVQAGFTSGSGGGSRQEDLVNNYFISGPATTNNGDAAYFQVDSSDQMYQSGNYQDANANGTLSGSIVTAGGVTAESAPWSSTTALLPTVSAAQAVVLDEAQAGASIVRDQLDSLDISQLETYGVTGGTSGGDHLYTSPTGSNLNNGGYGTLASGTLPPSTTGDGIPDTWALAHGMNVSNAAQATALNPLGYTMIEAYAASLANSTLTTRTWNSSGGEWNTPANWGGTVPGVFDIASVTGNGTGTDGQVTIDTNSNNPYLFQLYIGGNGSAAGESLTVAGGSLTVQDTICVGNQNSGSLTITGGTVRANNVQLGNTVWNANGSSSTTYTGLLTLNGGTLQVGEIVLGGGVVGSWTTGGSVNISGGTIQAISTLYVNAPMTINSGGATIDTNSFNGSITSVISGAGSLTKLSPGILALSNTNTYAGGTTLTGGEVGISGDANIGGSTSTITFNGGLLQVNGTSLTNLNTHNVNWSTFNGGFDIATSTNTFTVSQNLAGSGSMTKNGAGTLVLSGTSTFSGGVTLNAGTLSVSGDSNLGANGGILTFNGGTLLVNGTSLTSTTNHPLGTFGGGTFNISNAANTFTIVQQVNGAGTLTKTGPGVLVLGTRDYFTGDTYLNGGTLRVGDPLSLRYTTVHLSTAGTTLDLNGISETIGGLTGNQTLDIKGTAPYIGNNNTAQTFSGVLADSIGTGSIHKIGTGIWTLTGTNTFTGPLWISGGDISVVTLNNGGVAGPLGAGNNSAANLVLDGGALQFASTTGGGSTDHLFTLTTNGGTLDGSAASGDGFGLTNTGAIAFSGTGNRTLYLIGTETHNSFLPALGDADANSKTTVEMNGTGRWLWESKLSTYSGDTIIQDGTLRLYLGGFLPSGIGKGNVDVNSGGSLVCDISTTINALNNGSNGSSGTVTITSGTLTMGAGNASGGFAGVISGAAIAKMGAGTEILSGTNTYTGTTTITGGVLQFNIPGAIGDTGASVNVSSGAAAAAGYAINQAFLARINSASTGSAALALASANNLDFSSATGANLPNVSLGAVGTESYTGTITPYASTYLLGGGGGTLVLPNVQLTGSRNVTVTGPGAVSATGSNNYTGITTVTAGGIFEPVLAYGGFNSGMGQSTNVAANLVLDGGTLEGSGSTDRDFTLTANGGSLDNSLAVSFVGPGLVAVPASFNVTLTLTGSSTAHNLFNLSLADAGNGFITSVTKTGTGKWTFSADDTKTYSGDTTIVAGQLEALSNDGFSHNSNLVIDSGASLEMHDYNVTINGLEGNGATYNSFTNGTHTLTIGADNGGGTWAGVINSAATLNVLKEGTGVETFTAANAYVGNTTVAGGTLTLASTGSIISSAVYVSYGATFNLNGTIPTTATLSDSGTTNIGANPATGIQSVVVGGVNITSGGNIVLANPASHSNRTVLTTASLSLGGSTNSWQGQLDLGGNDLVVQSGNLANLTNQVAEGYNAGNWNGTNGIISSVAAANTAHLTAIGVIQNSVDGTPTGAALYGSGTALGTFDGTSPADADVLAKYTYVGDANLDGKVDGTDYSRIDYGYLNQLTGWYNGDFNYDGVVNGSDYTLIDNAFNTQGAILSNLIASPNAGITDEISTATSVPEPATLGLLAVAVSALLGRRSARKVLPYEKTR